VPLPQVNFLDPPMNCYTQNYVTNATSVIHADVSFQKINLNKLEILETFEIVKNEISSLMSNKFVHEIEIFHQMPHLF